MAKWTKEEDEIILRPLSPGEHKKQLLEDGYSRSYSAIVQRRRFLRRLGHDVPYAYENKPNTGDYQANTHYTNALPPEKWPLAKKVCQYIEGMRLMAQNDGREVKANKLLKNLRELINAKSA